MIRLLRRTFAALALTLVPLAAAAQQTASVTINVTSAESGEPLAGAQAVLDGGSRGAIADPAGIVRLTNLAAGEHRIEIRMLGYETRSFTLNVTVGERLVIDAALPLAPVAIEGIEATATPAPIRSRALAATGFYERMDRGGGGTFITRDEVERRRPSLMSDLFRRMPGVRVIRHDPMYNNSYALEMARGTQTMRNGGTCPVVYYVDGVQRPLSPAGIDELRPQDIEAIEIYRGSGALPPQYRSRDSACGVVAIWTRRYAEQRN
jgi:hypothetical protein